MSRITRRPLAAADILDIWSYIAEDSLGAADRWLDGIDVVRVLHGARDFGALFDREQ